MSRNSAGIPDPLFPEWFWPGFIVVVLVGLVVFFIYARYAGPCSWWAGSALSDVPAHCIKELVRP